MKKTNFDKFLEEQLKDPGFAARFERAGEAWDVALQIAALRNEAGLSQKDLAKLLRISQQQISRLESPGYEGHSLSTLRRVAKVLHARVRVTFEPEKKTAGMRVAEASAPYRAKRVISKGVRSKPEMSKGNGLLPKPNFVSLNVVKGLPSRCKCEILRCAQNDILVVKSFEQQPGKT